MCSVIPRWFKTYFIQVISRGKTRCHEDLTMKIQTTAFPKPFALIPILVLLLIGADFSYSAGFDCPPRSAAPGRICPPIGPTGSSNRPGLEHAEKAERTKREARALGKPQPLMGIIPGEMSGAALGSSQFLIENAWHEIVNGTDTMVYAGSMRRNPVTDSENNPKTAHGFVIIEKGETGQPNFTRKQLYTPSAVGSLRIIAADGNIVTLESKQEKKFRLNVLTEELIPIQGEK